MKKLLLLVFALISLSCPASAIPELVQNFTCAVQKVNTSVGTTASAAALLTASPNFRDVKIVNYGSNGAQVAFGDSNVVALATASADGTNQVYVPANTVMTVSGIRANTYFSAITDTSTTSIIIMVGAGR